MRNDKIGFRLTRASSATGPAAPTVRAKPLDGSEGGGWLAVGLSAPGVGMAELFLQADRFAAFAIAAESASRYGVRQAARELLSNCALDATPGGPSRAVLEEAARLGWVVADQLQVIGEQLLAGRLRRRGLTVAGSRIYRTVSAGCGSGRSWPTWHRYRKPTSSQ